MRCAQTREKASIQRTRAGDGSSTLVWMPRIRVSAATVVVVVVVVKSMVVDVVATVVATTVDSVPEILA